MYTMRRVALEPAAISASVLLSITFRERNGTYGDERDLAQRWGEQEEQEQERELVGTPVDSAVAEKDKEAGVRAVELPRGVREDNQPYICSIVDELSLGLHVGASGILISFPP